MSSLRSLLGDYDQDTSPSLGPETRNEQPNDNAGYSPPPLSLPSYTRGPLHVPPSQPRFGFDVTPGAPEPSTDSTTDNAYDPLEMEAIAGEEGDQSAMKALVGYSDEEGSDNRSNTPPPLIPASTDSPSNQPNDNMVCRPESVSPGEDNMSSRSKPDASSSRVSPADSLHEPPPPRPHDADSVADTNTPLSPTPTRNVPTSTCSTQRQSIESTSAHHPHTTTTTTTTTTGDAGASSAPRFLGRADTVDDYDHVMNGGLPEPEPVRPTQTSHPLTTLPPAPLNSCNKKLQVGIQKQLREKGKGCLLNELLEVRAFHNPYLLEKQASRLGIDEKGTMFPREMWDVSQLDSSCFYRALAEKQRKAIEQSEEKQKRAREIQFTPATVQPIVPSPAPNVAPAMTPVTQPMFWPSQVFPNPYFQPMAHLTSMPPRMMPSNAVVIAATSINNTTAQQQQQQQQQQVPPAASSTASTSEKSAKRSRVSRFDSRLPSTGSVVTIHPITKQSSVGAIAAVASALTASTSAPLTSAPMGNAAKKQKIEINTKKVN